MSPRYAIYVAPDVEGAEAWLGRSVHPAAKPPTPAVPDGWTREQVDAITRSAWRYGFHATLKAPFRLDEGRDPAELNDRLTAFAAKHEPVVVPQLTLKRLGGFFALVEGRTVPELHQLADAVVEEFDDLRAPLTEAEIAHRQPQRRDERERELLYTYGYPYVLDRFFFHLTLTDPIPPPRRDEVEAVLRNHFAPVLGRDLLIGAVALFVEPEPGKPLVCVREYPLNKEDQ